MSHTHFIGIGGTGLSAIARILLERGETVTGSDRELSPLAAEIQKAGAKVIVGHSADNVDDADLVIRSSAVPDNNEEVLAAKIAGIPVVKRVDYVGKLLQDYQTVAVAGTHGKTTTTSMIAWMFTALGLDPSFIAGGVVSNLGVNARSGKGHLFVIEADEYDNMFLGLEPDIAVVTNVEYDHPDFFATPADFMSAFRDFVGKLKPNGTLIACVDDAGARDLAEDAAFDARQAVTYGLSEGADYQARDLRPGEDGGFAFEVYRKETLLIESQLQVPGQHNVLNALAALVVADLLGLSMPEAAKALEEYRGAGRRFEVLGEAGGVTVVDDYAHHPTEIRATLTAARGRYPERKIWAVWQPHTYSRTRALMSDFATAFEDADQLVVTDVYAAREVKPDDYSHEKLIEAIQHPNVHHIPDLAGVTTYLLDQLEPGAVLLVLSAGDAVEVSAKVLAGLREKEQSHA